MRAFVVRYATSADLRAHLEEHRQRGAILLPLTEVPDLHPVCSVRLLFEAADVSMQVEAEVLQVLPGAGLVVRWGEHLDVGSLPAPAMNPATPEVCEALDEPDEADDANDWEETGSDERDGAIGGPSMPAGSSALSWPVEKLQAEWDNLSVPERIRVARYGNRGARMIAMRGRDKTIQVHLLANPNISTEEVASLAGSAALEPAALRRIASNRDWLRSSEVTRNLICNPKLPLPEVERLLKGLSQDELSRLNRSGRLRASVKQAVQKRLGRGQG